MAKEPLIYLIGDYDDLDFLNKPDLDKSDRSVLDHDILPPVPAIKNVYMVANTNNLSHKQDIPCVFLGTTLNLVVFSDQYKKKKERAIQQYFDARQAIQNKLNAISAEFNHAGTQTVYILRQSTSYVQNHLKQNARDLKHNFHNTRNVLNCRVSRVRRNLASTNTNIRLNLKQNIARITPPPVRLNKSHYAVLASAGALGLTASFVSYTANSNIPALATGSLKTETFQNSAAYDQITKLLKEAAPEPLLSLPETLKKTPAPAPEPRIKERHVTAHNPWKGYDTAILDIPLADDFRISSQYGMRDHPVLGYKKMHYGVDIAAPKGTVIEAPASGTVTFAGRKGGYGKTVILDHGNGIQTLYAHLSQIDVRKDEHVEKDEGFAKVGSTGRVTGAHLHFEIMKDGRKINPGLHIKAQRHQLAMSLPNDHAPQQPSIKAMR